ncbi:MAG: type II toxin-antitoxin system VapC family toxin [Verrucomicrobia bacterium]|nr:type II toxin-antitoxin system VapC family toxin [Verrucomicrobiota bacterium]
MQYWDTSTLAKLYVSEPDSAQFAAYLAATGPVTSSELARWELFRVLVRKEAEGAIPARAAEAIFGRFLADIAAGKVRLVPLSPLLETRFQQLLLRLHRLPSPLVVRTLDGVHIATADLHGAAALVATDRNMRNCAAAIGLKLYP